MNLQRYDNDGLEVFVDISSGETFASIRGYARMSGKGESTIRKRLAQGAHLWGCKKAEVQTAGGLQGAHLLTEDFIAEWLPKDNPEMATQVLKLGVRFFIHAIANFNQDPAPQTECPKAEILALELELVDRQIRLERMRESNMEMMFFGGLHDKAPDCVPLSMNITELPKNFSSAKFATALFQWMYANKFTQANAAHSLNISRSHIRRLLTGQARPQGVLFCKFAEVTGEPPKELLQQFID